MESSRVPLLGEQKIKATPNAIVSLVRHMDADGTFDPESSSVVNGNVQAIAGRGNLMSGEDLVEMLVDELKPVLRQIVREELARQRDAD
jgi:hypothetical protein